MEEYIVKILDIKQITHDVKRFRIEKPTGYSFIPGQATDVSINTPDLRDEKRPFTFTSLNSESFLEFTIKIYTDHNGITNEIGKLKTADELIIRDVWGAITYQGKGVFIAGGAGVTPFISILRQLKATNDLQGNMLVFANKTKADIILESEFRQLLGTSFINILSEQNVPGYSAGFISENFLKNHIGNFDQNFYVCGPQPMIDAVLIQLVNLGAEENSITLEL